VTSNYDIAIVGGGLVGAALACAFGGSGLKVAVLERHVPKAPADDTYDLRVSAITPASRALFEALGVWPGIAARPMGRVAAMEVWDRGAIRFDAADIGEPALAYIIENGAMTAALHARVQQYTNVHSVAPAELAAVEIKDGAALTLRDGRRISARLLVGADGADSAVRQYAGLALRRFALAQTAIVATVRTERPHDDTAFQHFLATGPLALLPLAGAHHVSIVWSADTPRAQALMALDDAAFTAELARAFGDRLGALNIASARAAFPLALTHAVDYTAPAVALVGDAAHTVHPLAGQGVNLGLLDAAALAEVVLDAHGAGKDIGAHHVLRRYERWRKGDNWTLLVVTGGFKLLFGNDWPLVREARNLGLVATDRVPFAKNLFMRRACGLVGDLPRLARRIPLAAAR